jgi:hypothetical protein
MINTYSRYMLDEADVEAGGWEAETKPVSSATAKTMTSINHSKTGQVANAVPAQHHTAQDWRIP